MRLAARKLVIKMMIPFARPCCRGVLALVLVGALMLAAPAASAQSAASFKGTSAALCIAAGERLGDADTRVRDGVLAWRQILHVMAGTDAQRQTALDSARASLAPGGEGRAERSAMAARAFWDTACASRDMQVRTLAVHASEDRVRLNLADEPGAEVGAEAAGRLNVAASCLVAAELFGRPRPSRALRAAMGAATPRVPEADVLRAIQAHARQQVDAAPGSAAGKELVVDYLRYLYDTSSGGAAPRGFVNMANQVLRDRCGPAAGTPLAP